MAQRITIALDAMGGDNAPASVVEGANLALKRFPDIHFQFYGNEEAVRPLLDGFPRLRGAAEIFHTDDVVSSDAKPSVALRQGTKSSMRLAINAVKNGDANGVVSAGNTGALMAMSKIVLRMLPNISRPAIISYMPTAKSACVMLDLGANIDCDAKILCQFAVMGDAFARAVLGVTSPSIGILNIGEEEMKGHESLRDAYQILQDAENLNFHGFVEGTDIFKGVTDVVVTDGFTGNVALKTIEGTADFIVGGLKHAFKNSLFGKLGGMIAWPALSPFKKKMDPRFYNGGMFIGLNGITVKSHGNADGVAFSKAIEVAYNLVIHDVNGKIIDELHRAHLDEDEASPKRTAEQV